MRVCIRFLPEDITIDAEPGEPLLQVAARAGITIPTGCLMGSCHACEVDLDGVEILSCLTAVPGDRPQLTVNLFSDPSW